jgi:hypothetical protein
VEAVADRLARVAAAGRRLAHHAGPAVARAAVSPAGAAVSLEVVASAVRADIAAVVAGLPEAVQERSDSRASEPDRASKASKPDRQAGPNAKDKVPTRVRLDHRKERTGATTEAIHVAGNKMIGKTSLESHGMIGRILLETFTMIMATGATVMAAVHGAVLLLVWS